MLQLNDLLKAMIQVNASDLHLTNGVPPQLRIAGKLRPVDTAPLTREDIERLCFSALTDQQKEKFKREQELDFSFGMQERARFRVNLFYQRDSVAGAIRRIPYHVPSFEDLGLPNVVGELAKKPRGLLLVTGPTGSGKSTTLASIVDKINREEASHILTIEDPIEYLHANKKGIVNQREVGADTRSFKDALRYVLRQDPDVVLIGEMRDLETIEAAMTLAETGHLCLATLHTNGAIQTLNRIIDVFPANQQDRIRAILSFVLVGVISQSLLPLKDGSSRALALEVLVPHPGIRSLIRDDKLHQIYAAMQIGQSKWGSLTLNQSLMALVNQNKISPETALIKSFEEDELKNMMKQAGLVLEQQDHVKNRR